MTALIVAGAVGGILAGIGGVVGAAYYGARLLEMRAEKRPVAVYFDNLGLGRAFFGGTLITVNARLFNPRPVPAKVEDITLWYEGGGLGLGELVDKGKDGYTTRSLTVEIPSKQAVTLRLGHDMGNRRVADHEERSSRKYSLAVTLSDGNAIWSSSKVTDFLGL